MSPAGSDYYVPGASLEGSGQGGICSGWARVPSGIRVKMGVCACVGHCNTPKYQLLTYERVMSNKR